MMTPGYRLQNFSHAQNRPRSYFVRSHRPLRRRTRDANHTVLPPHHRNTRQNRRRARRYRRIGGLPRRARNDACRKKRRNVEGIVQ